MVDNSNKIKCSYNFEYTFLCIGVQIKMFYKCYSKNKQVSDEAPHWGLRKNMKEVDIKDSGIEKSKDM
jgi:hypothetical protein